MLLKVRHLLFIALCFSTLVSGQTDEDPDDTAFYIPPAIRNNRYLNFLFIPDSSTQSSLFHVSYQYLYTPMNTPLRTRGMHLNVGLNLARFFNDKFIFGICYDLKQFGGFSTQHFQPGFVNDFNNGFIATQSTAKDSLRAHVLRSAINGEPKFVFDGNTFENIGISISPFPNKYGGFMLQLKKGNRVFPVYGPDTDQLSTTDDDYVFLQLNNCYSAEISFKPYRFFSHQRTRLLKDYKKPYKYIVVSVYVERLSMKKATFNGVQVSQIVDQRFMNKYNAFYNAGFKIGLAIY